MRRSFVYLFMCLALLAGCTPAPGPVSALPAAAGTPTLAPPAFPVTVMPTLGPAPAPATGLPVAPATPAATAAALHTTDVAPATLVPSPGWQSWSVYTTVLRSDAQQGLDLRGLTQYRIKVDLPEDYKSLSGQESVYYTNRTPVALDSIYLHLYPNLWGDDMTVSNVRVDGQSATSSKLDNSALVKINLAAPLAPGQAVELGLDFTVPIPSGKDGGNYGEFAYDHGVAALAHFYPTVVVHGDQGWHLETPAEQGDVLFNEASLYDVTLIAPAGLQVVPTGAVLQRRTAPVAHGAAPDSRSIWHMAGGPQRDFNIVASSQFQELSQQVGATTIYSHFLPEHAAGGKQALDWAVTAFKTYEQAFGPYPYRQFHVAETPTTAGGIEYPGLVVVASNLYDSPDRRDFFEAATTHEVAHQWWYNVVGNDQVNDPWLDEALAQYATYLYYEAAYGARGAEGFKQSLEARWQRVNNEDKPIGLPVAGYTDREYGAIVYGRGPLFLLAVEDKIGRPAMLKFLQEYYRQYRWGIATPAGFQALLQQVSGQDLSDLFSTWVYPQK
jgi:hypothetical protein